LISSFLSQEVNVKIPDKPSSLPEYINTIKVVPIPEFASKSISINVLDSKLITPGGFHSPYQLYVIQILPFDWKVERKYEECLQFRKILLSVAPNVTVPHLPKKKEKLETYQVERRKILIESFLRRVSENEVLRNTMEYKSFISIGDRLAFINHLKDAATKSIANTPHIDGKAYISYTHQNEIECDNFNKYCFEFKKASTELKLHIKKLEGLFDQEVGTLHSIANCYGVMAQQNELMKFNSAKLYSQLEKSMKGWAASIIKIGAILRENQNECFTDKIHSTDALHELCEKRINAQNTYKESLDRLLKKKEKLFKKGYSEDWKINRVLSIGENIADKDYAFSIMLKDETNEICQLHINYGYYTNNVLNQIKLSSREKDPSMYHLYKHIEEAHLLMIECWKQSDLSILSALYNE